MPSHSLQNFLLRLHRAIVEAAYRRDGIELRQISVTGVLGLYRRRGQLSEEALRKVREYLEQDRERRKRSSAT